MAVKSSTTILDPNKAADILKKSLKGQQNEMTVADASAKSGLSLFNAEKGLHFLISEFRGHLSATNQGELLFQFPHGFTKPWQTQDRLSVLWQKSKKWLLGALKFIVRAWITIAVVGYVVIFALILLALTFARSNDREGGSFGGTLLFHMLFRLILDSLFWTMHPFSPYHAYSSRTVHFHRRKQDKKPFYEKVNSFIFGPEIPPQDPLALKRDIIAQIRAKQGRIGLCDVIKVSGLGRDKAYPLMSQLMLEYNGEVSVSEEGALIYNFAELRKSANRYENREPEPIWSKLEELVPLTGNKSNTNLGIAALNGFNLIMSLVAIASGWTIEKLMYIISIARETSADVFLPPPPPPGTPLALGWVPLIFSSIIFAIPLSRYLMRSKEKHRVDNINGQRGMLHTILTKITQKGIDENELKKAWKDHTGVEPSSKTLAHEVAKLGGDIDVGDEGVKFRFKEIEAEILALHKERQSAKESERYVGETVFSSKV